jgi:hypothetical protein
MTDLAYGEVLEALAGWSGDRVMVIVGLVDVPDPSEYAVAEFAGVLSAWEGGHTPNGVCAAHSFSVSSRGPMASNIH